jgi:hypothetical protein
MENPLRRVSRIIDIVSGTYFESITVDSYIVDDNIVIDIVKK